jgi:hypothetical protein
MKYLKIEEIGLSNQKIIQKHIKFEVLVVV